MFFRCIRQWWFDLPQDAVLMRFVLNVRAFFSYRFVYGHFFSSRCELISLLFAHISLNPAQLTIHHFSWNFIVIFEIKIKCLSISERFIASDEAECVFMRNTIPLTNFIYFDIDDCINRQLKHIPLSFV